ncbi:MAG TPA: response regulator transcription factor [Vicinamibacterales bacterium]|jgi:DNA-binding response OmpR family regulator|nr:response regulator transcription factor [Vicinamibacterales bacterium]
MQKILVADDDRMSAEVLSRTLTPAGFNVTTARDGAEALAALQQPDAASLAILDWNMPELDGPDVCREVRAKMAPGTHRYLILLTSRDAREDVVAGLQAGADDYLVKPFHQGELLARVSVGMRVLALQEGLAHRVEELELALSKVKRLSGLLPICSYCKSIRSDDNYWHQVDRYLAEQSEAQFSHGICPTCFEQLSKELDEFDKTKPAKRRLI